MPVKGLPNIGSSCFINSVLQALYYIDELREFILKTQFKCRDSFAFYFQCIFENLNKEGDPSNKHDKENLEVMFRVFKSLCEQFRVNEQGDANHFVVYILNRLDREIIDNSILNSDGALSDGVSNRMIVSNLFRGQQEDRVICETCNDTESSKTKQYFFSLPLIVDKYKDLSIDELFMKFFAISIIDNANCPQCGGRIYKHTVIAKWPPYLIINICRACTDGWGQMMKVNTKIAVKDHKLILVDNSHLYDIKYVDTPGKIEYSLQATVNHYGNAHHGHYTCFSKTEFEWIEFNDLRIRPMDSPDVVSKYNNLLFFKKVRPERDGISIG